MVRKSSQKLFTPDDLDSYLIRNDYIHFLYAAMLLRLPFEEVELFLKEYQRHTNIDSTISEISTTLHSISNKLPFNTVFNGLNYFESYCKTKSICPFSFMKKSFITLGGVASRPSVILSSYMSVYIHLRYKNMDLRDIILDEAEAINKSLRKGTTFKCIKKEVTGNKVVGLLAFGCDTTPFSRFSHINGKLFFAMATYHAPLRFGGEVYGDTIATVFDCRTISEILGTEYTYEQRDQKLYIDNEEFGYSLSTTDYLQQCAIAEEELTFSWEDLQGIVITKELHSPTLSEPLLEKGAFYGASFYAYEMRFERKTKPAKSLFKKLFNESAFPQKSIWHTVDQKHNEFLQFIQSRELITIHFSDSREAITINNQTICKGDAALLLLYMLENYTLNKQINFTNKEIINSRTFKGQVQNSRFRTTLKRLIKALQKHSYFVKIHETGRGTFSLEIKREFILKRV